jgi:hypothetical protein
MLAKYPVIWEFAHRMVYERGTTKVAATDYLNGEIQKINAVLPVDEALSPISKMNQLLHFKNHVPDLPTVEMVAAGKYTFQRKDPTQIGSLEVALIQLPHPTQEMDDFTRIHNLVEASLNRLTDFDHKLREPNKDGSAKEMELTDIQLFQKLIKEAMMMKRELYEMQKSSNIAGEALREGIETLVRVSMDDLKKVLADVKSRLARELSGSSLPDEVASLILNALGKTYSSSIPELLASIEKRYKIK